MDLPFSAIAVNFACMAFDIAFVLHVENLPAFNRLQFGDEIDGLNPAFIESLFDFGQYNPFVGIFL